MASLSPISRGGLYGGDVSNFGEDLFNHLHSSHMERFRHFFRNKSKNKSATLVFVYLHYFFYKNLGKIEIA